MHEEWVPHILDDRKVIDLLIRELYGDDPQVSIREILQNAHDACVAARKLSPQNPSVAVEPPSVTVKLGVDRGITFISVTDTGIGMTREDLRDKLLAVGESAKSQWLPDGDYSGDALRKIVQTHADAIGKYGIGFLASFILARRVEVTTRPYDAPPDAAWRLTCEVGASRPPDQVSRNEPGTEVKLFLKDSQGANEVYKDRVSSLVTQHGLESYIRKQMYFSRVPVYLDGPAGRKLLTMPFPAVQDIPANEVYPALLQKQIGDPLAAQRFDISISDDGPTTIFLYLWPGNLTREMVGPASIWVGGMLVEESVIGCLPAWAYCFTALIQSPTFPIELDRRGVKKTSSEFRSLRTACLDKCVAMLEEFISTNFERFHQDVWPNIRGLVLPEALRAAKNDEFVDDVLDREAAIRFIRTIGPLLPLRVMRLNPAIGGYYPGYLSLSHVAGEFRRRGLQAPFNIPYVTVTGTFDSAIDPRKVGSDFVIDARGAIRGPGAILNVSDESGNITALLRLIEQHIPEEFSFREASTSVGDALSDDEMERGWTDLQERIARLSVYGDKASERYIVTVVRYKPAYLPAVSLEIANDENDVRELTDHLKRIVAEHPRFEAVLKDAIAKLVGSERLRVLVVNADNPVMQEFADVFAARDPVIVKPELIELLQQILEDARVDFYGGAAIGPSAQAEIYGNIRGPLYSRHLQQLRHGIDLSGVPVKPMEREGVVVFADLTKSSTILNQLDRREWGEVLYPFAETISRFIQSSGGFFDKFTGDGFLAVYFDEDERRRIASHVKDLLPRLKNILTEWANSRDVTEALRKSGVNEEFGVRVVVTHGVIQFGRYGRSGSVVGKSVVKAARLLAGELSCWKEPDRCQVVLDESFVDLAGYQASWLHNAECVLGKGSVKNFPDVERVWVSP